MTKEQEFAKAIKEFNQMTGLQMDMNVETQEEIEFALSKIRQLIGAYKEKYDKNYFYGSILKGELRKNEIENYAKKLHITFKTKRALYLIETKCAVDDFLMELLRNLFPAKGKNEIIKFDKNQIVLLCAIDDNTKQSEEEKLNVAHMIVDTVNAEAMSSVRVSFSHDMDDLSELMGCYAEASIAIKIGSYFYADQLIIPYNRLGIGGLLYRVPREQCENFLEEVFGGDSLKEVDEELWMTATKFFQYNLNIAETARQLHMHRNTLLYRIDQLQKKTGLDIRLFEDACLFRTAMMIKNYIKIQKNKNIKEK